MPIKTLHITNCYHESSGGIRTFYLALLEAANRCRREVRLIVPGTTSFVQDIGAYGRVYQIRAPASPVIDARYRLLLPHLYALPYPSRLRQILEQERPNLVEVCDKYALCFLPSAFRRRWHGSPSPAVFVGLSCERMDDNVSAFLTPSRIGRRFSNWYMRTIYAPRFDCHVSNSFYTAAELRSALVGRPDLPVHVCGMGVDCENFTPNRKNTAKRESLLSIFPESAQTNRETKLLLYAGRISREKNISLLLDLLALLKGDSQIDYRLLLAGSGPLAAWFKESAERIAHGRVHLLGHIADRGSLADIFANCDAMIHPNPREPFGIAPLEAMASGLPLLAPVSGGVLSYANEQNSWLAESTGESFARAVRQIFADDTARQDKINRALDTALEFSWARTTERFFDLYDRIYATSQAPSPPGLKRDGPFQLGMHA